MSQLGQDRIVDEYLHGKRHGVFVDIGAYDGLTFSDTLMLERERDWTGICIEPLPDMFSEMRQNRSCVCVQACIGNREEGEVEFLAVRSEAARTRMLSGVLSEYDPRHLARVDDELNEFGGSKGVIRVPMRHLHAVLHEHGIGHVDYLSIDTEGSELLILRSTILSAIGNPCVTVENNYDDPSIDAVLREQGYRLHTSIEWDRFYVYGDSALKLTLVTSIYPGNPAPQKRAIASWCAVPNIEVISLNSAVELPQLEAEGYDSGVRFIQAHRDGQEIVGKPVIHIYDAIKTGLASHASMIGLINSDVMLRVSTQFVERLWPQVHGGMVFGSRMEIPDADAPTGQVYSWGFDYFFMDRAALGCIEDEPFFFGVPWWDYWLPVAFIIADRKIARTASPIGFHVSHQARWDPLLYKKVGGHYREFIRRNFAKRGWSAIAGPHARDPYWGVGTLKRLADCESMSI
jgi:FkbM family methyltransferase